MLVLHITVRILKMLEKNPILPNEQLLCDLVPFEQFKKREKHLWKSVTFSKVAGWCTNGAKWSNASLLFFFSSMNLVYENSKI